MDLRNDVELWAKCEEDERYEVSTFGRVRGPRGMLTPFLTGTPKRYPTIRFGHCGRTPVVHRLMGNAFLPNPNNLPEIDHIDRNPQNNHISNLRWVSMSENQINKRVPSNNTSGVKGVYYIKRKDRWISIITRNGARTQSPHFKTKEEATVWRDAYLESFAV